METIDVLIDAIKAFGGAVVRTLSTSVALHLLPPTTCLVLSQLLLCLPLSTAALAFLVCCWLSLSTLELFFCRFFHSPRVPPLSPCFVLHSCARFSNVPISLHFVHFLQRLACSSRCACPFPSTACALHLPACLPSPVPPCSICSSSSTCCVAHLSTVLLIDLFPLLQRVSHLLFLSPPLVGCRVARPVLSQQSRQGVLGAR